MLRTLLERRRKLVDWAFSRVTPLDAIDVVGSDLRLRDRGGDLERDAVPTQYRVMIFDGEGRNLKALTLAAEAGSELRVPLGALPPGSRDGYLRVEVLVVRQGREAPRPAEFHLRPGRDAALRLVGVVH